MSEEELSEEDKKLKKELEELRRFYAAHTDVSYEKAAEFLMSIKLKAQGKDPTDTKDTFSLLLGLKDEKMTLGELAEMRALMRLIEAEALVRLSYNANDFRYIKEMMTDEEEGAPDDGRWVGVING